MNFFPKESFSIQSPLSKQEIHKRLVQYVEPDKYFRISVFLYKGLPYEGVFSENHFAIMRVRFWRHFVNPEINGVIHEVGEETRIDVVVKVPPLSKIGFTLISLFCLVVFVLLVHSAYKGTALVASPLAPTLFFLVVFFAYRMRIWQEADYSKKELCKWFKGKVIKGNK